MNPFLLKLFLGHGVYRRRKKKRKDKEKNQSKSEVGHQPIWGEQKESLKRKESEMRKRGGLRVPKDAQVHVTKSRLRISVPSCVSTE